MEKGGSAVGEETVCSDEQVEEELRRTTDGFLVLPRGANFKFEWAQTAEDVIVSMYVREMTKERCCVSYHPGGVGGGAALGLTVKLYRPRQGLLIFRVIPLYSAVLVTEESLSVSKMKVELHLRKCDKGKHWPSLERPMASSGPPFGPSISAREVDWEKACKLELDAEDQDDEDGLAQMLKQIYNSGNEETRRAMNKSFQTSGGTVLSTQWTDVKDKDYEKEIIAPEGQDVRKWES